MWKSLLPLAFVLSTLTFLGCIGIVAYGDNPYLSNKKNVHLATVEAVAQQYYQEIRSLENKVAASIQEEAIREFFLTAGRNLRAESTIGFADPFLTNLLVIDGANRITYAYAPLNIPLNAAPVRNGIALIDQETITITVPIEEAPNDERVIFVYNLRLLIKSIFAASIKSFDEASFKSYRYAYIYSLSPEIVQASQIERIEVLVDRSYEQNETIVYTSSPRSGDKLIGRQMSTGFFLGFFYQNAYGNIPLLSWVLLLACGGVFFLTGAQLLFSLRSARPQQMKKFFFRLRAALLKPLTKPSKKRSKKPSRSTRSHSPVKKKDTLASALAGLHEEERDEDDAPSSQIKPVKQTQYPEIPSLIASLENTEPPRVAGESASKRGIPPHSSEAKPDQKPATSDPDQVRSAGPSFSYRSVIRRIKPHARKLMTAGENRIPMLEEITGRSWGMILILDKNKAQNSFALSEFKGIDFQTAEQLIIAESDPLFKKFLTADKAFFIRDAHKSFLPQRIAPAQLDHLQKISSLLILPLKPAANRRVRTVLILG